MRQLSGILEFKTEFHWSKDVLDQSFNTIISNIPCTIYFPRLNELWFEDKKDNLNYLHMPLKAPSNLGTWYIGNEEKTWGIPVSYPSGICHISDLFFIFEINESDNLESISQNLYNNILEWEITFYKYIKLLSKQLHFTYNEPRNYRPLTLFLDNDKISDNEQFKLHGVIPNESNSINYDIVSKALNLTERFPDIPLYYELILNSYNEIEKNNFRKSVIDASTSLEVLLIHILYEEFDKQNISFGEQLLKKYTTIKGKFELLNVLNVSVPTSDYSEKILAPRNKAIHGGNSLSYDIANNVIKEVEKYLSTFKPLNL